MRDDCSPDSDEAKPSWDEPLKPADPVSAANLGAAHNLPSRLTSFIGREREITDVGALFEKHRLVTLAGPPGVGKTRLMYEVSHAASAGCWLPAGHGQAPPDTDGALAAR
jgi:hypothetical protein